ncbi:MAG: glycosyltransferase family 39 protein [Planctomycetes bacterium]|nr:glycosyltransferase family 39 protein [Planctomycetota bacterium]
MSGAPDPAPAAPLRPPRGRVALALLLIVLVAAAARFHGLDFGGRLPYARPDENRVAGQAARLLAGEWRPASFAYPALVPLAHVGVRQVARALGLEEASDAGELAAGYRAGRIVSATAGVATVLLLFALVRRRRSAGEALLAAGLLALAHLHVRDSHFGVTDTPLAAATTAFLLLLTATSEWPRARRFALCGAALGMAAAVKQTAVFAALPLLVEAFAATPAERPLGGRPLRVRLGRAAAALLLAAGCAAATFLLINPFALLEPERFLSDVLFELGHKTEAGGPLAQRGFVTHATFTLRHGLGLPFAIAAALGLLLCAWRARRADAIVLLFAAAYYLGMGNGTRTFVRYMVPLVPLAALFAARTLVACGALAPARLRPLAIVAAAAALLAPSTASVVASDRLLAARDSRLLMADALAERIGPNERVAWIGRYSWPPETPADPRLERRDAAWLAERLPAGVDAGEALRTAGFDWVVVADHWLRSPFDAKPEQVARLAAALDEVATFGPLAEGRARADVAPLFDRFDFLYLPYARFDGVARPGPFLRLFRCRR